VGQQIARIREPVLTGERKLSFARSKRAHDSTIVRKPPSEDGGYGSYGGYADEIEHVQKSA
jgi:hypothetical protein